jgi:hypothetical protein
MDAPKLDKRLRMACFQARSQNCEKLKLASLCRLSVGMEQLGYHWADFDET